MKSKSATIALLSAAMLFSAPQINADNTHSMLLRTNSAISDSFISDDKITENREKVLLSQLKRFEDKNGRLMITEQILENSLDHSNIFSSDVRYRFALVNIKKVNYSITSPQGQKYKIENTIEISYPLYCFDDNYNCIFGPVSKRIAVRIENGLLILPYDPDGDGNMNVNSKQIIFIETMTPPKDESSSK